MAVALSGMPSASAHAGQASSAISTFCIHDPGHLLCHLWLWTSLLGPSILALYVFYPGSDSALFPGFLSFQSPYLESLKRRGFICGRVFVSLAMGFTHAFCLYLHAHTHTFPPGWRDYHVFLPLRLLNFKFFMPVSQWSMALFRTSWRHALRQGWTIWTSCRLSDFLLHLGKYSPVTQHSI